MSSPSSSSSSSPEMDEAKQKAKRNILQFVTAQGSSFPIPGGASSNLTPTPPLRRNVSAGSPPVPLVRRDVGGGANPSTPRDLSADDVARHTKLKVQEIVRTLQDSSLAQPPVPKPRKSPCTSPNRSPNLSPKHPHHQPSSSEGHAHKPLPPRPPPPKFANVPPPQVAPPDGPVRTRSVDMKSRPKPTVRRRQRFGAQKDESREDLTMGEQQEDDIEGERSTTTNQIGENPANQIADATSGPGESEEWDIVKAPEPSLSEQTPDGDPVGLPVPPPTEMGVEPHPDDAPVAASNGVAALPLSRGTTSKKKPPPFRPPPYASVMATKTPPLPPKKRKGGSVKDFGRRVEWNRVTEEVAAARLTATPPSDGAEESSSSPPEHGPSLVQTDCQADGPEYETIEQPEGAESRPVAPPLLLIGRSNSASAKQQHSSKHHSLTALDVGVGGEEPTTPTLSFLSRAGTVAGGFMRSNVGQNSRSRPYSEASSLDGSFEMIPSRGGKLEDVMSTLREADEKLQDASVYEVVQALSRAMPHVTSTTDLPARFPDLPSDQRGHVIHELYTTEYTYVTGLEVVSEVFKDTLTPILLDETSSIFANVDDILAFNRGFLALLHSRLSNWREDQCVGDIFIGMFTQSHKSMYAIYCSNYDAAEQHVLQKIKRRKDFELALIDCLKTPRIMQGLTLQAYLITPIQRIPRYILLLKDMLKVTKPTHPDFKNLTKAQETMGELASYINAQVKESQTKKTFDSLKNKVHGLADLDASDRSLVKEGQVYLKNVKKLYQCILFNDVLVFAHGDSRQSKVELQLQLEAVWLDDLGDLDPQTSNEDAIEVYTPERPYTIYAQSSAAKRLWLGKLRETVYYHLLNGGKCVVNNELSTQSRTATFVYADGRIYTGEYVDSKRHGKGTMSWPNKTYFVGDWVDDERCGEGELTYNTGDVYRGRWSEEKQNGHGELQYASNDVYRGHWKDGVRHGDGKILYANGDRFEGHFVSGQIEGHGKLKCTNGVEYIGDWKHSQRHGKGRLKMSSGSTYNGELRYNHLHGQGTMHYCTGEVYEGTWKNGVRTGHGKLESHGLGVYEGSWEEDLRHGTGKLVYSNRDVYVGLWENNKRHGSGLMQFRSGEQYKGDFCNDMIHGEGEMKYSDISKFYGSWVNGLRHGTGTMIYQDLSTYEGDWRYGVMHGFGKLLRPDGAIYKGFWHNDKCHGKGTLHIPPPVSYTYNGDWVAGKREGRGEESSQYGQYKGQWKADMKHGHGEERTLVGTIFEGTWERSRKNGRGVRKMIFGTVEEQSWKSGQLTSDPTRMTAVELPYISRNDY